MDVRYTYDMKLIVNSLLYFLEDVMLVINVFETIGLQLVQCAPEFRVGFNIVVYDKETT